MAINVHISGPEMSTDSETMAAIWTNQMNNNDGIFGIDCSTGVEYSYSRLKNDVFAAAAVLTRTNVGRGDIVMALDSYSYEGQVVLLAGHLVGAIIVPLCNSIAKVRPTVLTATIRFPDIFVKTIDRFEPDVFFYNTAIQRRDVESILNTVVRPPTLKISSTPFSGFTDYSTVVVVASGDHSFVPPIKPIAKNDPCVVLHSSGSTGAPKPIVLSHDAIKYCSSTRGLSFVDASVANRIMTTSILGYSSGFKIFVQATLSGTPRLFFSSKTAVDAEQVLRSIEKYKPTALITKVPYAYEMMSIQTANSHKYDIDSLCTFIVSGFAMRPELQNAITANLLRGRIPLKQRYGTTETGTIAQWPLRSDVDAVKSGFVGTPAPGVKVKVVSLATGKCVGPNAEGEIRTKTASSMIGYAYDIKKTIKSHDEDGWFKTGDIGYYTDDCCLYVVSRIKEVMWYNGRRVAPVDIESVLLSHFAVLEAAVTYKESLLGDLFVGVVRVKRGQNIRPDHILSHVNDRVEDHQKLRGGLVFLDDFPKTASGKLNRVELRNIVCGELPFSQLLSTTAQQ